MQIFIFPVIRSSGTLLFGLPSQCIFDRRRLGQSALFTVRRLEDGDADRFVLCRFELVVQELLELRQRDIWFNLIVVDFGDQIAADFGDQIAAGRPSLPREREQRVRPVPALHVQ